MSIFRTILRVVLIAVLVGLLVFLSIKIFKLIPQAINSLASATVSISGTPDKEGTKTPATPDNRVPEPVTTTPEGLNGVIIQPNTPAPTATIAPAPVTTTAKPTPTRVNTTPVTTTRYTYVNYPTYTYSDEPIEERVIPGGRNIKLTLTSVGVIDETTGQFVRTNTFRTTDTVSVKFKILNEEDSATGPWNMRVTMPAIEYSDRVKILNNLSSIPGESSYAGEARFTGIDLSQGTPVVRIHADPDNMVAERNESDNTLAVELRNVQTVNIYNPGYNYDYEYYYNNNNTQCYYSNGYQVCPNNNGYNSGSNNQCYSQAYGWYNCGNGYNDGYNSNTPNLNIASVEVGRMVNGSFYQSTTIPYGERVAIRVRVRNTGGYFGNSFSTRLGITNQGTGYRELFATNGSIQAGGEQTVYFDISDLIRGNHTFSIMIDSNSNVSESNESDNNTTASVYVN